MSEGKFILYAVSDATGDLAVNIATSAARQFQKIHSDIRRRARVDTPEKVTQLVDEVVRESGLIVYTFVSSELRKDLHKKAKKKKVPVIDIMGPTLETLARFIHEAPSDRPGMQYELTRNYYRRNDAVEFTVVHDDGLHLDTLGEADIIIIGISRTSKTPLAMYLAFRGFKVANIPIVKGVDLAKEVYAADRRKMIGVTVDSENLEDLRASRLSNLGRSLEEDYVDRDYIEAELEHQRRVFADLGNIPVINVTKKAIEEAATEILIVLGK